MNLYYKVVGWINLFNLLWRNRRLFGTHGYTRILNRQMSDWQFSLEDQIDANELFKRYMKFFKPEIKFKLNYVGANYDGGYFIADLFDKPLLVSGGAGKNIDFERIFQSKGGKVIVFDGTISRNDFEWHDIKFENKNLGIKKSRNTISLSRYLRDNDIVNQAKISKQGLYMKLDIEGGEYDVLTDLGTEVAEFDQLVIEFHDMFKVGFAEFRGEFERIIQNLSRSFISVSLKANNWDSFVHFGNLFVPNTFEITLVNIRLVDKLERNSDESVERTNNPYRIPIPNQIFLV